MRLPRSFEERFVFEYLLDFNGPAAAKRAGIVRSWGYVAYTLLQRKSVQARLAKEMEARRLRLQIDADFVLQELVAQLGRLRQLIETAPDVTTPLAEWPTVWKERGIAELTRERMFERSHDGEQRGNSRSWDEVGEIVKIKRESLLQVEKEYRACLSEIGRHTKVKAFPVPGHETNVNVMVVTAETARKVASAKRRLETVAVSVENVQEDERDA